MSINVIIILALALIVLIVLVVVFTGRVQLFGKGLGTCRGSCVQTAAQCTASAVPTTNCDDGHNPVIKGDAVCCIGS
jgi:hypothetical protein